MDKDARNQEQSSYFYLQQFFIFYFAFKLIQTSNFYKKYGNFIAN